MAYFMGIKRQFPFILIGFKIGFSFLSPSLAFSDFENTFSLLSLIFFGIFLNYFCTRTLQIKSDDE